MQKYQFDNLIIIRPDGYTTEQVEALIGVLAEAGLDDLINNMVGGIGVNPDPKSMPKVNWVTPVLKKISAAGIIHKAAACALYEEGGDFSDEAIARRMELTKKLPFQITLEAVIDFLSTVFAFITSSKTALEQFKAVLATKKKAKK